MTFKNMYELMNHPTLIRKSHFWDYFDSDVIDPRWTFEDSGGTPTYAMIDAVDEGFETKNQQFTAEINFGGINPYEETGSVLHTAGRRVTASTVHRIGFRDDVHAPQDASIDNLLYAQDAPVVSAFKQLLHGNDVASNITTSVSVDLLWTFYRLTNNASSGTLHIANILEATAATNLSSAPMEPFHSTQDITVAQRSTRIRYIEAYNT